MTSASGFCKVCSQEVSFQSSSMHSFFCYGKPCPLHPDYDPEEPGTPRSRAVKCTCKKQYKRAQRLAKRYEAWEKETYGA